MFSSQVLMPARNLRPPAPHSQLIIALTAAAACASALLFSYTSRSASRTSRRRLPCAKVKESTAVPEYRWCAFVSHDPLASFLEAQWLQTQLQDEKSGSSAYVDTNGDENYNAQATTEHIRNSKVFILLQTKGIYKSPHRLYEVMTALEHGIPLVMVAVDSGTHRYAIGVESLQLRKELARTIDVHCLNFLAVHGYQALEAVDMISRIIPSLISTKLDLAAPHVVRIAMVNRIARLADQATPCPLDGAAMVYSPNLQRQPSTPRYFTPRGSQLHANLQKLVPIPNGNKRPKIEGAKQRLRS